MTETDMRIQSSHTLKESSLELQCLSTCKIETQLGIKVIAILNPITSQQTGKRGDPKQKVYLWDCKENSIIKLEANHTVSSNKTKTNMIEWVQSSPYKCQCQTIIFTKSLGKQKKLRTGLNNSNSCTHVQWPSIAPWMAVVSYNIIHTDFISSLALGRGQHHILSNIPSFCHKPGYNGKTPSWCWVAQQNIKRRRGLSTPTKQGTKKRRETKKEGKRTRRDLQEHDLLRTKWPLKGFQLWIKKPLK
jgi:hypothetical protein